VSSRPFLGFPDRTRAELLDYVALARDLKGGRARGHLGGKVVVLYFANPSVRTRASMESALARLGGHPIVLDAGSGGVWGFEHRDGAVMDAGLAEHVKEGAKVLSRYADAIGVRAFAKQERWQDDKDEAFLSAFARSATVPVFSLEGACRHPLQGLADAQTIQERLGEPRGKKLVLAWAPHPKPLPMAVPNSIVETGALLGMEVVVARPDGWALDPEIIRNADAWAREVGGSVRETSDRDAAFEGAHVVNAKCAWGALAHYGDWPTEQKKRAGLGHWIIKERDLARGQDAIFMHCLPVRRNVVVEDAVLDGPRSVVIQEAENRLWTAQAFLLRLLGGGISRDVPKPIDGPLYA
jgi:N-acetylornithine carbamoyltransferase